jgi:hypothetical protein
MNASARGWSVREAMLSDCKQRVDATTPSHSHSQSTIIVYVLRSLPIGTSLSGTISEEIGQFTALTELSVADVFCFSFFSFLYISTQFCGRLRFERHNSTGDWQTAVADKSAICESFGFGDVKLYISDCWIVVF